MRLLIFCTLLFYSSQGFSINGCQADHISCIISSQIPYQDLLDLIMYFLIGFIVLDITYLWWVDFSFLITDKPFKFNRELEESEFIDKELYKEELAEEKLIEEEEK